MGIKELSHQAELFHDYCMLVEDRMKRLREFNKNSHFVINTTIDQYEQAWKSLRNAVTAIGKAKEAFLDE